MSASNLTFLCAFPVFYIWFIGSERNSKAIDVVYGNMRFSFFNVRYVNIDKSIYHDVWIVHARVLIQ